MADNSVEIILKLRDEISGKIDNLNNKWKDAVNPVKAFSQSITSYLGPAAIGAAFAFVLKETMESEKAINSLKSAVEIAGGKWSDLGKPMQDYAKSLQDVTKYSDEEVMDVMNRLITITGSAEDGWKGTKIALDMAATGMFGTEQAAKMVGMAMSGNVMMLSRYIPELKGLNKTTMATASASERAEYAMKLLQEKFGGRAQAEVQTLGGAMTQLKNQVGELAEMTGEFLIPTFKLLIGVMTTSVKTLISMRDNIVTFLGSWARTTTAKSYLIQFETALKKTGMSAKDARIEAQKMVDEIIASGTNAAKTAKDTDKLSDSTVNYKGILESTAPVITKLTKLEQARADGAKKSMDDAIKRDVEGREAMQKHWDETIGALSESFQKDFVDLVTGKALTLNNLLDTAWTYMATSFVKIALKPMTDSMAGFVEGMVSSVTGKSAGSAVGGAVGSAVAGAAGAGGVGGAVGAGAGVVGAIGSFLSTAIPGLAIVAGAGALINTMFGPKSSFEEIQKVIQAKYDDLKKKNLALPKDKQMPVDTMLWLAGNPYGADQRNQFKIKLAEGGIVTKPTMALIGEAGPEAVVPLSKGKGAMGGFGGVNITINTMAYTGDDRSIRALARMIDKALFKEQGIGRTVNAY